MECGKDLFADGNREKSPDPVFMNQRLRALELYCGIGGFAAAVGEHVTVAAGVDINLKALAVYARNFHHVTLAHTIESLTIEAYRRWDADLWWLSPPCQPYTRRGHQRDLADSRSASLLAVLERIGQLRPRYVALENVPGFHGSQAYRRLRQILARGGYVVRERMLCPTELGVPNRRQRFYLVAARSRLLPWNTEKVCSFKIDRILLRKPSPQLQVPADLTAKFAGALHVVDPSDPRAESACFTAAYGRSPVRSGSYLPTAGGIRRFAPQEILRLLCFPNTFSLPPELTSRQAWPLVGNSLSVLAVRHILTAIPELSEFALPLQSDPADNPSCEHSVQE